MEGAALESTRQTVVLVRHGVSVANEYKEQVCGTHNYAISQVDDTHFRGILRNASLSMTGVGQVRRHRNTLWEHIEKIAGERRVTVFTSPIRRALETCLESLDCDAGAQIIETGNMKIYPLALVMESGSSYENNGVPLDHIEEDLYLNRDLHGKNILTEIIDWKHFWDDVPAELRDTGEWWSPEFRDKKVPNAEDAACMMDGNGLVLERARLFEKFLEWRREQVDSIPDECVVVFTHWGFVTGLTGISSMQNFGKSDAKGNINKCILQRLDHRGNWKWFR